ncbi:MAG: hypothetical protein JNK82_01990 [Myxococcaceae bacterium]|nr:hypothetical protein [Myxococcaceae bacterium]
MTCLLCAEEGKVTEAKRTYEGDENDGYTCAKGHTFSIDWSSGEATEPQYPPSSDLMNALSKAGGAR